MFSLLLLIVTIALSAIIIRIGAIALSITGVPLSQAGFQAMSAYTGTGFTTQESELVLSNPQRRRIIKILIIIGTAGVMTTVATLAGTMVATSQLEQILHTPQYLKWLPISPNIIIIALFLVFLYGVYYLLNRPSTSRLFHVVVTNWFLSKEMVMPAHYEELSVDSSGYGVVQIDIHVENPIVGKTIEQTHLYHKKITILSLIRRGEVMNYPDKTCRIDSGNQILCYGPVGVIRDTYTEVQTKKEQIKAEQDAPLTVGSMAPNFELRSHNNQTVKLQDYYHQKNVVLIFYLNDRSTTCELMLKTFVLHLDSFKALDTAVLAINPASSDSHKSFCKQSIGDSIPLLSDPEKAICKAYKAVVLGGLSIDRTVYIIDKTGIIRYAKRGMPGLNKLFKTLKELEQ